MAPWSISIKSVGGDGSCTTGGGAQPTSSTASATSPSRDLSDSPSSLKIKNPSDADSGSAEKESKSIPSLFTVEVDSEAPLWELSECIERVTGLKSYQQRLIYRGRILSVPEPEPKAKSVRFSASSDNNAAPSLDSSSNDGGGFIHDQKNGDEETKKTARICDIQGLDDGHTIHLVPRRNAKKPSILNSPSTSRTTPTTNNDDEDDDDDHTSSSSMASNLLSAILGLGAGATGGTGWSTMTSDGGVTIVAGTTGGDDDEDLTTLGGLSALIGRASDPSRAGSTAARRVSNLRATRAQRRAASMAASRNLSNDNNNSNNSNTGNAGSSSLSGAQRQSNSASGNGSSNAPHRRQRGYRDGVPALREAGSLEPVRQGIMTLNTVLGAHRDAQEGGGVRTGPDKSCGEQGYPVTADTSSKRTFYKGQWIDVKDTVNQWLEATVLDIVTPSDVLGKDEFDRFVQQDLNDTILNEEERKDMLDKLPIVSASDLEGRRQLLLKSTPASAIDAIAAAVMGSTISTASTLPQSLMPTTVATAASTISLNDSVDTATTPPPPPPVESLLPCTSGDVQLLRVHYNGWPHRWDEWIRSDSHRIRPFRTRTRHSSSVPYASPNIHSLYDDSPHTYVRSAQDEALEREALIPELSAVLSQANEYVRRVADGLPIVEHLREEQKEAEKGTDAAVAGKKLGATPGSTETFDAAQDNDAMERKTSDASDEDEAEEAKEPEPDVSLYPRDERLLPWRRVPHTNSNGLGDHGPEFDASPLKTRNEDAFTNLNDVSFASSVGGAANNRRMTTREDLQGLASLLDRLGRTLTDMAPHVASLAASLPEVPSKGDELKNAKEGEDSKPPSSDENSETIAPAGDSNSTSTETTARADPTAATDRSSGFALLDLLNTAQASTAEGAPQPPTGTRARPTDAEVEAGVLRILSEDTTTPFAAGSIIIGGADDSASSTARTIPNPVSNSDPSMPLLVSLRDTADSIQAAMATTSPGAATSQSLTLQQQRHRRQGSGGTEQPNESVDFINGMVHARSPSAATSAATGSSSASSSASRGASTSDRGSSRARSAREAIVTSLLTGGPRSSGVSRRVVGAGRSGNSSNTNNGGENNDNDTERGGGGTGRTASIDVHFHTVITPPGFGAGGIVFGGMGAGGAAGLAELLDEVELSRTSTNTNRTNNNNSSPSNVRLNPIPSVRTESSREGNGTNDDDDEMGLFDGLYGESNDDDNDNSHNSNFGRLREAFLALVEESSGTTRGPSGAGNASGVAGTRTDGGNNVSSSNTATNRTIAATDNDTDDDSLPPLVDRNEIETPPSSESEDDSEEDEGNGDNESTNHDDDDSLPPLLDQNEVAEYSSSSSSSDSEDQDAEGLHEFVLNAVNAVRADDVLPMLLGAGADLVVELEGADSTDSESNGVAPGERRDGDVHVEANQYVRPDTVVLDRSDEDDEDDIESDDEMPPLVDAEQCVITPARAAAQSASVAATQSSEMEISDEESTSSERHAKKHKNNANEDMEDVEGPEASPDSSSTLEDETARNDNESDRDEEGGGLFGVLRRFGLGS